MDDLIPKAAAGPADQPASPRQARLPLIVPKVPHLQRVLHLSDDIFCVRPQDLVRKATDELAFGLHWYILYTMTHSALECETARGRPSGPAVTFVPGNVQVADHGAVSKVAGPKEPLSVNGRSEREMRQSWSMFKMSSSTSLDTRSLLKHVHKVNTPYPSKSL
jgi:hypothetical protein